MKTPPCPFCGSSNVSLTWYGGETGDVFRCNEDMKLFAPGDDWYEEDDEPFTYGDEYGDLFTEFDFDEDNPGAAGNPDLPAVSGDRP